MVMVRRMSLITKFCFEKPEHIIRMSMEVEYDYDLLIGSDVRISYCFPLCFKAFFKNLLLALFSSSNKQHTSTNKQVLLIYISVLPFVSCRLVFLDLVL